MRMKKLILLLIGFALIIGWAEKKKSIDTYYSVAIKSVTESQTPDKNTQILLDYFKKENLLDIDKLKISINKITVPNLNLYFWE